MESKQGLVNFVPAVPLHATNDRVAFLNPARPTQMDLMATTGDAFDG